MIEYYFEVNSKFVTIISQIHKKIQFKESLILLNMIKYCLDNFINDDIAYDNVMEIYDDFTKAFKLASKDGLVLFT